MTISQEWWDRKSMCCLWPHCLKGSNSTTTISVNKNHRSEDTFRIFHCFDCDVKSLFDFIICHTGIYTLKEKWHNFQMDLPAHIFSPAGCQCVCDQSVAPLACLVVPPQHEECRLWGSQLSNFQFSNPQHLKSSATLPRNNDWAQVLKNWQKSINDTYFYL